ncbi:MAG: kynureninase [Caulobacteraceae bacterium]|nr:kynureninase [Caulobacteraceae bacterium]
MITLAEARARDRADPLARFRARFRLPRGAIYLDGNSLGALPRATPARVRGVVEAEWGRDLIRSWNDHGWIDAPARVGAKIAPLVGAKPSEVVVADSTSVALFKLLAAALALRPGRRIIVTEPGNFPTDLYVARGLERIGLCEVRLADPGDIEAALEEEVAALLLTQVHYKSAAVHDMARLTAAAHARGALVLWDLSHSAGAIEVDLNGAGADLAVGCGYKYLSGGPGAPAFLYVAERHQDRIENPISGWMGHAAPFDFHDDYRARPGIVRMLTGTPPVVALAALEVGVDLVAEIGVAALAAKSRALSAMLVEEVEARCGRFGIELASPRDPKARGSHVSFRHPEAHALSQALIAEGVIGDFRAPDTLRLGLAPAYLRFVDVWKAAATLEAILAERRWDRPEPRARRAVT